MTTHRLVAKGLWSHRKEAITIARILSWYGILIRSVSQLELRRAMSEHFHLSKDFECFRQRHLTADSMASTHNIGGGKVCEESRVRQQQIIVLISCFTLTFTGCGINFAFGVYQDFYGTQNGPFLDASPAKIDLIGTLSTSLMTLAAPIAIGLTRILGNHAVLLLGGALFALSGILASFGSQLWHFQLSQGLLQGLSICLTYIPAVTISPAFFSRHRALAMGIITSGTGIGGMVWAPVLRYLISTFGFRNTLRIAGLSAAVLVGTSTLALSRVDFSGASTEKFPRSSDENYNQASRKSAVITDPETTRRLVCSKDFVAHAVGTFFQSAAYMIPIYFMSSYAQALGYTATAGANMIALSNIFNSFGKVVVGCFADRVGRLNALVLCTFFSAWSTLALCYLSTSMHHIAFQRSFFLSYACIYGITAGTYVSLFPAALVDHFGIVDFAQVNGLLYMIRGIGALIGTPVGGEMVRYNKVWKEPAVTSDFDKTLLLAGSLLLGATCSVAWARSLKVSSNLRA